MATSNYGLTTIATTDQLSNFPTVFNANMNNIDSLICPTVQEVSKQTSGTVSANTWTACGSFSLPKGRYLITVPFFRNQGGVDTIFNDNIAFKYNDSTAYSGDAMSGTLSCNWGNVCMSPIYVNLTSATNTVYIWVRHAASTAHTIDVRLSVIKLG